MRLFPLLTLAMSVQSVSSDDGGSEMESSWSIATTISSEDQDHREDRKLASRVVGYWYKSWQTTTYPDGTTTRQEFEFTTGAGDDLSDLDEGVCETELENVNSPMNTTEASIYCHHFKDVFNLAFVNDPCDFELDYCRVFSQHFTVTTYHENRFVSGGNSRKLLSAGDEDESARTQAEERPAEEQQNDQDAGKDTILTEVLSSSDPNEALPSNRSLGKRIRKKKKNKVKSRNRGRCNTECPVEELFFEYLNRRRSLRIGTTEDTSSSESISPASRRALRRRSSQTSPTSSSSTTTTTTWKPLEESQLSPEEKKKIEEFQTKELAIFCYNFLKTMATKQDLTAFYGMSAISVQCAKTKVRCNIELGGGDSTSRFFNPPEWDGA